MSRHRRRFAATSLRHFRFDRLPSDRSSARSKEAPSRGSLFPMPPCATLVPRGPRRLRSTVVQQASGVLAAVKTMQAAAEEEERRRERRRRQRQQVVNCCKQVAAFLFSHLGLAAMVVAYSIMGGFLFRAIEAPAEALGNRDQVTRLVAAKTRLINDVIDVIAGVCDPAQTTTGPEEGLADDAMQSLNETLKAAFLSFQVEVRDAVKDTGWSGSDDITDESSLQWTLAGAILYAVTVITTIGYGHIAPKTLTGRMLTIVYALVGIPLTFLYLSNIGNFLADCFRLFYKRICCDIVCCQKCRRRQRRERLKTRRRRELLQRNVILNMHSDFRSTFPPPSDDDVIDDDDDVAYKSRFASVTSRNLTVTSASERFPAGNPGIVCDATCDDFSLSLSLSLRPSSAFSSSSSFVADTFPSTTHSSSSRSSKNTEQEREDDDDDDDEDDVSGSESSARTVREAAIVDVSRGGHAEDDVTRESDDVDGDFSSRRSSYPTPGERRRDRRRPPPALPSFHLREFHRRPEEATNRKPDFARQGTSVPNRSTGKGSWSGGRKGRTREEDIDLEKAKANWRKLIQYTKQVVVAKGRTRKKTRVQENRPEVKRKLLSVKSPPKIQPDVRQREPHRGPRKPHRGPRDPIYQSQESFVTAGSSSAPSDGDGGDSSVQSEARRASLDSIAVDVAPSLDAAGLPEVPDFVPDHPISFLDDPFDYEEEEEQEGKVSVPIPICLVIICGYLFAGSALFAAWEKWDLITGSYFCFITLSTIGFGDIVPGTDMTESEAKLVLCALWLAFGLSLLAMCFNLMQEEVKDKCKWIGQMLGLLKDEGQN